MKKVFSILTVLAMVVSLAYGSMSVQALEDQQWILNASQPGITSYEQNTGEWEGIQIDATNGKFSPREADVQINAGTILSIPVSGNEYGATIVFNLSGGSATISAPYFVANGNSQNPPRMELNNTEDTVVAVTFETDAYVESIEIVYNEQPVVFPGDPAPVDLEDKTYTLNQTTELLDENGILVTDPNGLQQSIGTFDDIKVDATNGKFAPRTSDIQVNAGTILYVPVTVDEAGVSLVISGTVDGSTPLSITVDGQETLANSSIDLAVDGLRYVTIEINQNGYLNALNIDYASDTGLETPEVNVQDKTWYFTDDNAVARPNLQGNTGDYDGIHIDATLGKFGPREGDTQINGGTTLYIPVAADSSSINITVNANNNGDLDITFDGNPISVNFETSFINDETRYIPLTFEGDGSCYLYNIVIDYTSYDDSISHTVVVGSSVDADYATINEALTNETSSSQTPLIIALENGVYEEKVTIDMPNVTLTSLSGDPSKVIIKDRYYSSNTFDAEGNFIPQDGYDVGTNDCATVLVTANGRNFTATNITIENSYNIEFVTEVGGQTPAVALYTGADRVALSNCRIIGRQDTLYVNGSGNRVYFDDCYIEGTVDFVFGKADAFFNDCTLHMASYPGRDSGYYTAPNTEDGEGLVFYNCTLTADESLKEISLGRPWQNEIDNKTEIINGSSVVVDYDSTKKHPNYENISSKSTYINCTMNDKIIDERWSLWRRRDVNGNMIDVTYHDSVFFKEINSKDASGQLLNPSDYPDIPYIRTGFEPMVVVDDVQSELNTYLNNMRIGANLWLPDFTVELPGEVTDPDNPGGEVTDPDNPGGEVTDPDNPGGEVTDPDNPGEETTPNQPDDPTGEVTPSGSDDTANKENSSTQVSETNKADVSVATGDNNDLALYTMALFITGASIVITYESKKRLSSKK